MTEALKVSDLKVGDRFLIEMECLEITKDQARISPPNRTYMWWPDHRVSVKEILPKPIKVGDTVKVKDRRSAEHIVLFQTETRSLVIDKSYPWVELLVLTTSLIRV